MMTVEQPRNFTPGAVRDIERNHGVILNPFETSLARLVTAGRPLWLIDEGDRRLDDFMKLVSRPTQVAIFPNPRQFYVPGSNNKTLEAQRRLLEVDEVEVVRRRMGMGGLRLIVGDVVTHAGLVFAYFDNTGGKVRLHGEDYDYRYARTETPIFDSSRAAVVGFFGETRGLAVHGVYCDYGDLYHWAVRLGVPAQE